MAQSGLGSELWHESPPIGLATGHIKAKVGSDPTLPLRARGSGYGEAGKGRFCSRWLRSYSVHSPQSVSRPLLIVEVLSSARLAGGWLCSLSWEAEFLPCVMKFMVQIPGLYTPGKDSNPCSAAAGCLPLLYLLLSSLGLLGGRQM